MRKNKLIRENYIRILREKTDELGRFPKKSDFDEQTVSMIKSLFGPWPRALEAAGVKPPSYERLEKHRQKRIRARQNRIRYRKEHPKNISDETKGKKK